MIKSFFGNSDKDIQMIAEKSNASCLLEKCCKVRVSTQTNKMLIKIVSFCCLGTLIVGAESTFAQNSIGVEVDVAYTSKYLWRGYDILNDHSAFQPSVNLELLGTGLSIGFWGSYAHSAGFRELYQYNYILGWGRTLFEKKSYQVDFSAYYSFDDFPNTAFKKADIEETGIGVVFPGLLNIGPGRVVPSWFSSYCWPAYSSGPEKGWFNIFGLSYSLPVPVLFPGQKEMKVNFSVDLTHNTGAFSSDSGWSHSTFCIGTSFKWNRFKLKPTLYYQWSIEATVNKNNEGWLTFQIGYKF